MKKKKVKSLKKKIRGVLLADWMPRSCRVTVDLHLNYLTRVHDNHFFFRLFFFLSILFFSSPLAQGVLRGRGVREGRSGKAEEDSKGSGPFPPFLLALRPRNGSTPRHDPSVDGQTWTLHMECRACLYKVASSGAVCHTSSGFFFFLFLVDEWHASCASNGPIGIHSLTSYPEFVDCWHCMLGLAPMGFVHVLKCTQDTGRHIPSFFSFALAWVGRGGDVCCTEYVH